MTSAVSNVASASVDPESLLEAVCGWRAQAALAGRAFGRTDAMVYLSSRDLIDTAANLNDIGSNTSTTGGNSTERNQVLSIEGIAVLRGACKINVGCAVVRASLVTSTAIQAGVFAHELGHLLGATHDGSTSANTCPATGFLMQAVACAGCPNAATEFSSCSQTEITSFVASSAGSCVRGESQPGFSTCGNGLVDPGEQCGTAIENNCCNRDCTLKSGAQCDPGTKEHRCCTPSCALAPRATPCRDASTAAGISGCDVADTCDGASPLCPDTRKPDASGCPAGGACLSGRCVTRASLCTAVGATYSETCDPKRSCTLTCASEGFCVNLRAGSRDGALVAVPDGLECRSGDGLVGVCRSGQCAVSAAPRIPFTMTALVFAALLLILSQ